MANKPNVVPVRQYPSWLSSSERARVERSRSEALKMIQKRSTKATKKKEAETHESESNQVGVASDETCICRLCLEVIDEPNDSNEGQDAARSIHCDGECNGWLHRRCAGLSLTAFSAAVNSSTSEQFFCTHCQLKKQAQEIQGLKATIMSLTDKVEELQHKAQSSALVRNSTDASVDQASASTLSGSSVPAPVNVSPSASKFLPATSHGLSRNYPRSNRRFNLLIFGIKESAKGTKRHIRFAKDIESSTGILSSLDSSVPSPLSVIATGWENFQKIVAVQFLSPSIAQGRLSLSCPIELS